MPELEFTQETHHPPTVVFVQLTEKALFGAGQALVRASVQLAAARRRRSARPTWATDPAAIDRRLEELRHEQARWLLSHRQLW
jgi:hypothetical protein